MRCTFPVSGRASLAALLGLSAAVALVGPFDCPAPVAAQPPAALPEALKYVPTDAAVFLYADAAKIWNHEIVKTFRDSDKATFGALETGAAKALGVKLEDLKSVVVFLPTVRRPEDTTKLGLVLTFAKPFDKKKLEDGMSAELPKNEKLKVFAPDARTAVVLRGLDDAYAVPRPAEPDGPLAEVIKAAGSGKHALAAGVTFANMPEDLRKDDLPGQVRGFQPIFMADTLTATVDLDKAVALAVRVKARRAAQAVDAEKALGAAMKLIGDELARELPDLEKDGKTDPGLRDVVKVLRAVVATAKGAKFAVDGSEAQMTAALPLAGLPLATAYTAGLKKVQLRAVTQQSANNLKQIAIAMHNYASTYNDLFPPAAVCDKRGKPQLSWRVLILPYIEQDALYKQFKLDEPWDSENNKKLLDKMPKVYAIPGVTRPGGTDTHYRVFVGNGAAFDWVMGTKITAIADGTSNTLMCVTAATAVPWTKPDELEFDPEKDMGKLIGLVVNGKAQVALCDGTVRTLAKLPPRETVAALVTMSGGEVIGNDF
ncbi:MAG: DUF1559 domain-containing protein [Gemmata sp.]